MEFELSKDNALQAFEAFGVVPANKVESWLDTHRSNAINRFSEMNFPTAKHEDWKYTDTRSLTKRSYDFFPSESDNTSVPEPILDDSIQLVFENGKLRKDLSTLASLPEGLTVTSLVDAGNDNADIIRQFLGQAIPKKQHGFSALNDAFIADGAFIHIVENVHIRQLINISFIVSADKAAPLIQPRNLIVLDENAQGNVLFRYIDKSEHTYLTNSVDEIFVGKNATLEICKLQEEGRKSGHIGGLFIRQSADSTVTTNTVSLDGRLIRNDVVVNLDEPGAECFVNGLTNISGRQHVDHHTQINHNVPDCTSHEHYKSVLDGRSRSVFHGRIVVEKDAQRTDSEQQNQTLLLSRDAEIDTKPQLEIYADDVKCSHGATVGQLDNDSIFYLRSRGIDEVTARSLLTTAFAHEAIAGISQPSIRTYIESRLGVEQNR